MGINRYHDLERTRRWVAAGEHRGLVGGYWDEVGTLARDLLVAEGLQPGMTLLDIGCGCLRVGVRLVEYLDAGRYYGTDLSEELLAVGYERELRPLGLAHKLPRHHLVCDDGFDSDRFPGNPKFDMSLALSLFTHLPPDHLRRCLETLEKATAPGAKLIVTIFHCENDAARTEPITHEPGGITTYPDRDPFHHRSSDLGRCVEDLRWAMGEPRKWGHPRDQAVVVFERT